MDHLQPFEKDFYKPHPNLVMKPIHEIEAYRAAKEMTLKGKNVPCPITSFDEANFPDYVMNELRYFFVSVGDRIVVKQCFEM